MPALEVNFSELSNKPKDTVDKLNSSPTRSLRVHRRDGEDLVLTTVSRAEQEMEVSSATTKLFLALMQHDEGFRTLTLDVLPAAFPWVRFLPRDDVREFAVELVETLRAAEPLHNPAPVAQVVTAWRHTAEVHADPSLLEILNRDGDDWGAVPAPDSLA